MEAIKQWNRECGAGPLGMRGNPAPPARPYLVPTRDWGVVVDMASVPETNLADSPLVKHLNRSPDHLMRGEF
jgi:hypothetical protein